MLTKSLYESKDKLLRVVLGRKCVFHHVPKCAGTSVSRALRTRYFLSQHSLAAPRTREILAASRGQAGRVAPNDPELRKFRILLLDYLCEQQFFYVGGHVPFSDFVFERHGQNRAFITVLRDPVERFLSEFHDVVGKEPEMFPERSIRAFAETPLSRWFGCRYCEYFSGALDFDPANEEQNVRQAMERLSLFDVVGFSDRLDEFAKDLSKALGARIRTGHANQGKKPAAARWADRVPSEDLRYAREICAPDIRIYQRAKERLS